MSGAIATAYGHRFSGPRPNLAPTASLVTPTFDGSGVTTEPTWIVKPSWVTLTGTDLLAHNPLTGGSDEVENPSLLISNDHGATWSTPPGVPNPIQPKPTPIGEPGHNADVHLFADPNVNRLILTWAVAGHPTGNQNGIWYSISTDPTLATWSSPARLIYVNGSGNLSATEGEQEPKLVYDAHRGRYVLFTQDAISLLMRARISESNDPVGAYGAPVVADLPMADGSTIWHMDVIQEPSGRFVMILCDNHTTEGLPDRRVWLGSSWDGAHWKMSPRPVMSANDWATQGLYRPSITPARSGNGYDVIVARVQTPDSRFGLVRNIPATEIP